MKRRIRGRRVASLLASALPLLAEDDHVVDNHVVDNPHHAPFFAQSSSKNTTTFSNAVPWIAASSSAGSDSICSVEVDEHDVIEDINKSAYASTAARSAVFDPVAVVIDDSLTSLPALAQLDWRYYLDPDAVEGYSIVVPFRPSTPSLRPPLLYWNQTLLLSHESDSKIRGSLNNKRKRQLRPLNFSRTRFGGEVKGIASGAETIDTMEDSPGDTNQKTEISESPELYSAESALNSPTENVDAPQEGDGKDEGQDSGSGGEKIPDEVVVMVDYASKSAGALILEKSPQFQGTSNLLNSDKDKYALVPCAQENKSVVIGLSEDIHVKQIALSNYERYSSHVKEFSILGSQTMGNWFDLGAFTAKPSNGKQTFDLQEPSWARYLKFRFISHYGDEHYCTVSQISVHGNTMLQGFHEEWGERHEEEVGSNASDSERKPDWSDPDDKYGLEEGSRNKSECRKPFPPVNCITNLDAVCPSEWSIEKAMLLYSSSNASDEFGFLIGGALSAASVCLSSHQSAKSFSKTWGLLSSLPLNELQSGQKINNPLFKSGKSPPQDFVVPPSPQMELSKPHEDTEGEKQQESLTDAPFIKQLQDLIKTTAKIEVEPKRIKTGLLRPLHGADGSDGLSISESEEFQEKQRPGAVEEQPAISVDNAATEKFGEGGQKLEQHPKTETQRSGAGPMEVEALLVSKDEPDDSRTKSTETTAASTQESEGAEKVSEDVKSDERRPNAREETGSFLARLLQRLPSAGCLKNLDFPVLKAAKVVNAGGTGIGGNAPTSGAPMEPIFKKLTDEIKALQAAVAAHDKFAQESTACYQRVMLDLIVEMEESRVRQEARFETFEREVLNGSILRLFLNLCSGGALSKFVISPVKLNLSFVFERMVAGMEFLAERAGYESPSVIWVERALAAAAAMMIGHYFLSRRY